MNKYKTGGIIASILLVVFLLEFVTPALKEYISSNSIKPRHKTTNELLRDEAAHSYKPDPNKPQRTTEQLLKQYGDNPPKQ